MNWYDYINIPALLIGGLLPILVGIGIGLSEGAVYGWFWGILLFFIMAGFQ